MTWGLINLDNGDVASLWTCFTHINESWNSSPGFLLHAYILNQTLFIHTAQISKDKEGETEMENTVTHIGMFFKRHLLAVTTWPHNCKYTKTSSCLAICFTGVLGDLFSSCLHSGCLVYSLWTVLWILVACFLMWSVVYDLHHPFIYLLFETFLFPSFASTLSSCITDRFVL